MIGLAAVGPVLFLVFFAWSAKVYRTQVRHEDKLRLMRRYRAVSAGFKAMQCLLALAVISISEITRLPGETAASMAYLGIFALLILLHVLIESRTEAPLRGMLSSESLLSRAILPAGVVFLPILAALAYPTLDTMPLSPGWHSVLGWLYYSVLPFLALTSYFVFAPLARREPRTLSSDELDALRARRGVASRKNHLRDRILFVAAACAASSVIGVFTAASVDALSTDRASSAVALLFCALSFILQIQALRWLIRRQDFEADAFALANGTSLDALARALRKQSLLDGFQSPISCDDRIALLGRRQSGGGNVAAAWSAKRVFPKSAAAALVCAVAIAIFFWIALPQQKQIDLAEAVRTHDSARAAYLLDQGASPSHASPSLIHVAAESGDVATLQSLVAHGADVNQRGPKGLTPLMRAAARDRYDAARFLISKGADPSAKDESGSTALDYANTSESPSRQTASYLKTLPPGAAQRQ